MKDIIKMNKLAGTITESQAKRIMDILNESEFQPLFKSIRDLPIVDFQRKQFDQLNDLYNAYLVSYANEKGEEGSKMSPNELNRKYGEEIRSKLGVDSIRTADIATALIKAGLIKQ